MDPDPSADSPACVEPVGVNRTGTKAPPARVALKGPDPAGLRRSTGPPGSRRAFRCRARRTRSSFRAARPRDTARRRRATACSERDSPTGVRSRRTTPSGSTRASAPREDSRGSRSELKAARSPIVIPGADGDRMVLGEGQPVPAPRTFDAVPPSGSYGETRLHAGLAASSRRSSVVRWV